MLLLTSTADLVQVATTAAVATHVQASYVDLASGATTPGRTNIIISAVATTTVVSAPASGAQRNLKHLSVRAVGGSQTVSVVHTDGTTAVTVFSATLVQGEQVVFTDGLGFQVLDATGALKTAAQPQAGRLIKSTTYSTAGASGNHTTDPKTASVRLRLLGAGGGGGGASSAASSAACGGGGGAGAYVEKLATASPSTAYAYQVGSAGAAGSTAGGTGGIGGSTTFAIGGTTYTAAGGVGGTGQTAATTAGTTAGGSGGAGTNGDTNVTGNKGFFGNRQSGTAGWSGDGADSTYGGGGPGLYAAAAGSAATGFCAGGGGGLVLNGSTAVAGGAGAGGLIIVDEYS